MAEIEPVESSTIGAIYAAIEHAHDDKERFYLGISGFGTDCDRQLWYGWRKCHAPEVFDGRKLRLFNTGHREEARMVEDLRRAGVDVQDVDPATGEQFEVKAYGGHLSGHLDGRAVGIVEAPKAVHVVEIKTHNEKSFKALLKDGVEKSKPGHFRQMQLYAHLMSWPRAFYLSHNKNDDTLYAERITYDPVQALQFMARAERIIKADAPPPKLHEDPDAKMAWQCRYCVALPVCHERQFARVHCRTCLHSTPVVDDSADAKWRCERHDTILTVAEQMQGCSSHLYIPGLVPGEQEDVADDFSWVAYRMPDGSTWMDSAGEGKTCQTFQTNSD